MRFAIAGAVLLASAALGGGAFAQPPAASGTTPLITAPVDEQDLVTLGGNTRPEANAANDRGAVDPAMLLAHLQLLLHRSPAQEQAVDRYLDSLHDPASPNFHHWLSAAEFGQRFGANPVDVAVVRAWLAGHGFRVGALDPGGMLIDFSGTAGEVEAAFHTPLHRLEVGGEPHFANMRDPQIPRALAPVVTGVVKLNDFRPLRKHRPNPNYSGPNYSGRCYYSSCYLVAPADLATIYDFNPLFHAASPITGQGQSIAVAEDTDLYSASNWYDFRRIFGLSGYTGGSLVTIHPAPPADGPPCSDPGVNTNGDDIEATLDAEWSSAAAPDALIVVAACANTGSIDGVQQAIHYLIASPVPPPIISVSYGVCEAENGATGNAVFSTLYQQATAEGISVFVATGDSGPEDCAPNFTSPAAYGIGVNGWASTRYNVAVGGTDFSDTFQGTNADYWDVSSGRPWGTARSYIPEMAWNDTCASDQNRIYFGFATSYGADGFCNSRAADSYYLGTGGGEGGPSGCASGTPAVPGVVGGTCAGWPKPAFQTALFGMPDDGVRNVPDVSMFASDGSDWKHQYLICFTDPGYGQPPACSGNPSEWGLGGGGTSYATPIVAGIQALVNQKMGGKQGNPNYVYYALAAQEYGAAGASGCDASLGPGGAPGCVFHDVTAGNDAQDCLGPFDCYLPGGRFGVLSVSDINYEPAYRTTSGYDFPTGIGTIDAANLVNAWAGAATAQ